MAQADTPARQRRPKEETRLLGEAIYERDIRAQVEADHCGEIMAIDVDSGDYAIAETVLDAAKHLREQRPEVVDVWLLRIGYKALYSFGAGSLRRTD